MEVVVYHGLIVFGSVDGVYLPVVVRGAGHLVPHDQPLHALVMLNTFLGNESFSPTTSLASDDRNTANSSTTPDSTTTAYSTKTMTSSRRMKSGSNAQHGPQ